jgi:DNA repair protein RecO
MPFAPLELTFYNSEKESTGYISDIEILEIFTFEKDSTLGRLAYASAATELIHILLSEKEPHRQLYTYYINFLQYIDTVEKQYIPALFIAFFLRLLSRLGYHPSISYCIFCSKEITIGNQDPILFCTDNGGSVCSTCQKPGDYYISLSPEMFKIFLALQTASLQEAATIPIGLSKVTLLQEALTRFISSQVQIDCRLKSLAFIEKLKNSNNT